MEKKKTSVKRKHLTKWSVELLWLLLLTAITQGLLSWAQEEDRAYAENILADWFFIEYIVYSATHNLTGSSMPILIIIFIFITNVIVFSKSAQK